MPFKNPACCSSGKHRPFQQLHSLEATIKTILKENKHFSSKCLSVPSLQLKVLSWAKAAQHQQLPELPPGKSTRAGLSEFWLRLAIDPWKFCTFLQKVRKAGLVLSCSLRGLCFWDGNELMASAFVVQNSCMGRTPSCGHACTFFGWSPAPQGTVRPCRILRCQAAEDGFQRGMVLLPAGQ